MMTSTDQQKNWSADHSRALSDGILRDKNKTSETEVEGWFTRIFLTHTSLAHVLKDRLVFYNAQPNLHVHKFKAVL